MNMEIYIYEIKLNCPDRCFRVLLAGISSFWLQDFFYIYLCPDKENIWYFYMFLSGF